MIPIDSEKGKLLFSISIASAESAARAMLIRDLTISTQAFI
jgi:hypothetical protein